MQYKIDPMRIASDPLFAGGGMLASALFDRLVSEGEEQGITRDDVGYAWAAACLAYDAAQAAAMDGPAPDDVANMAADFLPQRSTNERPMVQIGDAQVFVYMDDSVLRVNVVTEKAPGLCVQLDVDDAEVWSR